MVRLLELFGGIGAPRMALEMLGIECESVDYVEIDKYATKSYNAMYNEDYQPRDIKDYNPENVEADIIFHGSPCQDFSIAGNQAGGDKGSGTRSSLLWETLRIVDKVRPTWVIWENVRNVLNKKHKPVVDEYINELEKMGYASSYQILNAIDFGIPQNRQRVFCVSKLGGNKEDITFPQPRELRLKLADMLEPEETVEEKYYYSEEQSKDVVIKYRDVSYCIDANYQKGINPKDFNEKKRRQLVQVPGRLDINGHDLLKRVYDPEGSSPTLNTMTGGNRQPKVIVDGVYTDQMNRNKASAHKDVSVTIKAQHGHAGAIDNNWRIRKLTPKECWRLMGFPDTAFDRAEEVNSNSQLYKQAGNSIVVPVIAALYQSLEIS